MGRTRKCSPIAGALAVACLFAAGKGSAQTRSDMASVVPATAAMGSIRITGLPGETANDRSKQMEIMSWSFGGSPAGSAVSCAAAPGTFSFRKAVDVVSVSLQKAKAARTRLTSVQLDTETQSFRFQDAHISSYQPAPMPGDSKSTPMEEKVTIRFGRCERIR